VHLTEQATLTAEGHRHMKVAVGVDTDVDEDWF
jgi:hypothetical protein